MAAKHISNQSNKRQPKRFWTVVLVVSLVVFVGSLSALGALAFSYWQGQQTYNRLSDVAALKMGSNELSAENGVADSEFDLGAISVNWEALRAVNPDVVAWIYVPNTPINYPVVQGSDDEYYLYHDFEGTQGVLTQNGCVFMKAENNSAFTDAGTFLFGHHLNDGSMLSAIADESTFVNAKAVYLFTPTVNMKLHVFSLVHCPYNDPLVQVSFGTKAEQDSYLVDKIQRSVIAVEPSIVPSSIDRFVALATCDNQTSNGRYVLYCFIEEEA